MYGIINVGVDLEYNVFFEQSYAVAEQGSRTSNLCGGFSDFFGIKIADRDLIFLIK
jgi:hypothetical protein